MNEALLQLISLIKEVSPTVWAIMLKQVYVVAWASIFGHSILMSVSALLIKTGIKFKQKKDSFYEDHATLSFIGAVTFGIIALIFLIKAVMRFINPEFYAISYLLAISY